VQVIADTAGRLAVRRGVARREAGPGELPRCCPDGPQLGRRRFVTLRQQSGQSDRPEQVFLIAENCQVGDGFTAVGKHHCQIHSDPARVVPALPRPAGAAEQ
jgi:hypothetical protein